MAVPLLRWVQLRHLWNGERSAPGVWGEFGCNARVGRTKVFGEGRARSCACDASDVFKIHTERCCVFLV